MALNDDKLRRQGTEITMNFILQNDMKIASNFPN